MNNENVRRIIKNGRGSYYINIPRELVKELKLKERQKVVIKKYGKGILINDWKK